MNPTDFNLIEVAKQYTAISLQVSQAFNIEQAKLELDLVLSYNRLSSSAGTQESLNAIQRLGALTDTHRDALGKIFTAATSDLTKALSKLPEAKRAEYRDGLLKSLHGQLAAQSQFYENRKKWVEAAQAICHLVEARRDTSTFNGEAILFEDEADADRLDELMVAIEDAHRTEVVHMKQMLDRFSQSASILGLNAQ